jgi:hypothetical protein
MKREKDAATGRPQVAGALSGLPRPRDDAGAPTLVVAVSLLRREGDAEAELRL